MKVQQSTGEYRRVQQSKTEYMRVYKMIHKRPTIKTQLQASTDTRNNY